MGKGKDEMSHITDGLLHAHLDGAVGPERKDEWILAEAHLSVCEDCRRKLDDERQIRGSASAILASAASPIAERPKFDQLVAAAGAGRAATVPRRAWWSSTSRLAWAASLMLAVGAGWLGRELLIQTGRPVPAVVVTEQEQQTAPAAEMLDQLEADAGRGNRLDEQVSRDAVGERARDITVAEQSAADAPEADMQKSQAERFRAEERQDRDAGADGFADNAAALPDDEAPRRAAAPQFAEHAVVAECFTVSRLVAQNKDVVRGAEDALDRRLGAADATVPEQLRLLPDGIATAYLEGQELQGTWSAEVADSLSVILSGAESRLEMRLARVESGLSGGMEFAPVPAEMAAKLEGEVRADAEVQGEAEVGPVGGQGAGAAVAVVLTATACEE